MTGKKEFLFYVSVGAGLAFGTSSFTMLAGLFGIISGLWVVIAIILAGLFCMVIAGSVAELASMYPSSPGIRTYLKVAFGNNVSLFLVHTYLTFIILIAGVESYVFALVFKSVFPNVSTYLVVFVLLALIIMINLVGMEVPRWFQMFSTYFLIAVIIAVGLIGFLEMPAALSSQIHLNIGSQMHNLVFLPAATALGIFLYIGFEWVTPLGFRPTSYKKKIANSMLVAILINMVAYICFSIGMPSQLRVEGLGENSIPQMNYFSALYQLPGIYFALLLSFFAVFSTFNAGVMGSSKLIFILARERCLPAWCAYMSNKGVLTGAVLILGGLAFVSALFVVTYELELTFAVIGSAIICFIYSSFVLALIIMRRKAKKPVSTFTTRVPLFFQWAVVFILPAMGIQALISQPGMGYKPLIGMMLVLTIAFIMTIWSLRLQSAFMLKKNTQIKESLNV